MTAPVSVAVTGAGGYLGGRVVGALVEAGVETRAIARRPVAWLPIPVTILDLDQAAPDDVAAGISGCSAVVHLAGANEVAAAREVDASFAATVAAGRRVAAACTAAGVERLVVLSTTHVYGASAKPGSTVSATSTIPQPRHPYALARLAVEHAAVADGPKDVIVLRLTNAVGAPADARVDRWSLVANDLCRQAVAGPELLLQTSGLQWRDFIALHDAVDAITRAAQGRVPAGTYDLGSGSSVRVLDLAELIARRAGEVLGRPTHVHAPVHEGPAPDPVVVDVGALLATGWRPSTPLDEAIDETLRCCIASGRG